MQMAHVTADITAECTCHAYEYSPQLYGHSGGEFLLTQVNWCVTIYKNRHCKVSQKLNTKKYEMRNNFTQVQHTLKLNMF